MTAYYQIEIVKGDDFELIFKKAIKNCETGENEPVDLTNVTDVISKIYTNNGTFLENISGAVTDITGGEITLWLPKETTETFVGTDSRKPVETIGRYDTRLKYSNDKIETLMRGNVILTAVKGA
jgi:hypothetical protein